MKQTSKLECLEWSYGITLDDRLKGCIDDSDLGVIQKEQCLQDLDNQYEIDFEKEDPLKYSIIRERPGFVKPVEKTPLVEFKQNFT